MKKNILFILLMISSIVHAQNVYDIDYSYESLSTTDCNVFYKSTTVDNFVHQSTIGFPSFSGANDYAVQLPCVGNLQANTQVGTEYQILYSFKKGNTYVIKINYKGIANDGVYPFVAVGLNKTAKDINSATTCTGPKPVSVDNYAKFFASGSSFVWTPDDKSYNTGVLTDDYASVSIAGFAVQGGSGTIEVQKVEIVEWCNQPPLGTASGLTGTLTYTTPPAYGYALNFTTVPDATKYNVEWYDVTNSAVAATFSINGPGYLYTGFTSGHTYRYRVQAVSNCVTNAAYSGYSPDLAPPGGTCEYGPLASSLTATVGGNINLSWPAVPGATQYNAQYIIYQPGGITRQPVTIGTSTNSASFKTPLLIGSGWVIKYRVQANCGSGFGSYSDYSASYFIQ